MRRTSLNLKLGGNVQRQHAAFIIPPGRPRTRIWAILKPAPHPQPESSPTIWFPKARRPMGGAWSKVPCRPISQAIIDLHHAPGKNQVTGTLKRVFARSPRHPPPPDRHALRIRETNWSTSTESVPDSRLRSLAADKVSAAPLPVSFAARVTPSIFFETSRVPFEAC